MFIKFTMFIMYNVFTKIILKGSDYHASKAMANGRIR